MARVIVSLSGGVDSAVAAWLLQEAGHDVAGLFMKNWEDDLATDGSQCTTDQDFIDAQLVALKLKIKLYTVNFSESYWNLVFEQCLAAYRSGVLTPNPDILCNQEIKFKVCLNYVLQELRADFMATGHYVQNIFNSKYNLFELHAGLDNNKDQSYFLYRLTQQQLAKVLFPLGKFNKTETRELAKKIGLRNAQRPSSRGLCFIEPKKFSLFLKNYLPTQPGPVETLTGETIGTHQGLAFYTIGQRHGLNIGGVKNYPESPWYVIKRDPIKNLLIVAQGKNNPALFSRQAIVQSLHWIAGHAPQSPWEGAAKIRYRQPAQSCSIKSINNNSSNITVYFNTPQRAITAGQSLVFYDDHRCLGGGFILPKD